MKTKYINTCVDFALDFCVAIYATFKILNYSCVKIFEHTEGYLDLIFLANASVIFLAYIILLLLNKITIHPKGEILIVYVGLVYYMFLNCSSISSTELTVYFIIPLTLGMQHKINMKRVLLFIMLISSIALLKFDLIFEVYWHGGVNMDISYSLMPSICAAIVFFIYYNSEINKRAHKIVIYSLYAINIFYLWKILLYGERGTVLCIIFCIYLGTLVRIDKGKVYLKNIGIKFFIFGFLILLISFLPIQLIFSWLDDAFEQKIYAIHKLANLSSKNDVSNGRFQLYLNGLDGFLNAPFVGHGISSFGYYYNSEYPHNVFIQLLFDGGIILFLFVVVSLVLGSKNMIRTRSSASISVFHYSIILSFVFLSYSQNIWNWPMLWLFCGILIKFLKKECSY